MKEDFLKSRLNERRDRNAYRELRLPEGNADFCSNDYLGIVTNQLLDPDYEMMRSGSTGSRLLSGNYDLIEQVEDMLAAFHEAEAALVFNSGYDANSGLLSCVAQKGDTILYDVLSHASIRDGIRLSAAQSFAFRHNDMDHLETRLAKISGSGNVFVVTESVFSMDGDLAPLAIMAGLCERFNAHLIVDEAHATGVIGLNGEGLVQSLLLQDKCFARIHTFGKAVGCHGAAIFGSRTLRHFLINFSRPFIYSTSLPDCNLNYIEKAYQLFPGMHEEREQLDNHIKIFQDAFLPYLKIISDTPIQGIILPGNDDVKALAEHLQDSGLDVRPILYPTVPEGSERLRIILHSYNTEPQLRELINKITCF